MEKIPLSELAAREWTPNSPRITQARPHPCMEPSQRRVPGLQAHLPDRALDFPRSKDGSSSAQLAGGAVAQNVLVHLHLCPCRAHCSFPWEWWISDPCKITDKVPDERSFHRLWAPYGPVVSCPSHIAGEMSLVFAETNFHCVNGTKTGVWWKEWKI